MSSEVPEYLLQFLQQLAFVFCEVALGSEGVQHATVSLQLQVAQDAAGFIPGQVQQERPTAGAHPACRQPPGQKH